MPRIYSLFDCVSVRANLYQQAAGCQILIIMPIVKQNRTGKIWILLLHLRLQATGKPKVHQIIRHIHRSIVTSRNNHNLSSFFSVYGDNWLTQSCIAANCIPMDVQDHFNARILC